MENLKTFENFGEIWYRRMTDVFLKSYLENIKEAEIVPSERNQFEILLRIFLVEKCIYEIGYEANNRPDWLFIPLKGVKRL